MDRGVLTGRLRHEPPRPHRILTPQARALRDAIRGVPEGFAFDLDYRDLELRILALAEGTTDER